MSQRASGVLQTGMKRNGIFNLLKTHPMIRVRNLQIFRKLEFGPNLVNLLWCSSQKTSFTCSSINNYMIRTNLSLLTDLAANLSNRIFSFQFTLQSEAIVDLVTFIGDIHLRVCSNPIPALCDADFFRFFFQDKVTSQDNEPCFSRGMST